jgi:L-alanine-DL-glutamate epimerase-like enolase superfamily enzyme
VALANAVHCDADLPWREGGLDRDLGAGLEAEVRDGVSTVHISDGPGLGIVLDEDAVAAQRVDRRW